MAPLYGQVQQLTNRDEKPPTFTRRGGGGEERGDVHVYPGGRLVLVGIAKFSVGKLGKVRKKTRWMKIDQKIASPQIVKREKKKKNKTGGTERQTNQNMGYENLLQTMLQEEKNAAFEGREKERVRNATDPALTVYGVLHVHACEIKKQKKLARDKHTWSDSEKGGRHGSHFPVCKHTGF